MAEANGPGALPGTRFGQVALVGRPNAGKSTLMNQLLGEKLAIVSDKPQTTRHRILGILGDPRGQMVLLDTPGTHRPLHRMNRQMMDAVREALAEADVVCVLIDASEPPGAGERFLLDLVAGLTVPKVLVLNKIDQIKKHRLLPRMAELAKEGFADLVPISALTGDGCDRLLDVLWGHLPPGEPRFDPELLTIHPERFLAAERIREKVLAGTEDELPFTTAVVIEKWEETPSLVRIHAAILVERDSQKGILIGKQGSKIREIGTAARHDLEAFLDRKVYLELFVRHEADWRENPRVLADLERQQAMVALSADDDTGDEDEEVDAERDTDGATPPDAS
jgi:GTP-binding protein Era